MNISCFGALPALYRNAGLDLTDMSTDGEGLSMFHLKHLVEWFDFLTHSGTKAKGNQPNQGTNIEWTKAAAQVLYLQFRLLLAYKN